LKPDAKTSRETGTGVKSDEQPESICSYLEWDSSFFGSRIARLQRGRLDAATLNEALVWCRDNHIDCLYFLADADHAATVRLAESDGFQLTDVRMTLKRAIGEADALTPPSDGIRLAREQDLTALRAIARMAHHDSRFYFDEHFDREKCDLLYQTWIENSFHGFAQAVLVAEVEGRAAGYLTCHLKGMESQIGLVGIAAEYQGRGLGSRLIRHSLSWSREQGATRAVVVTQGRNLAAQRLYQRNGFISSSLQLWYHLWFRR
jgi:dTDP-4-amino-4,6-dideoxy-D-galactose acyltransferase